MRRTFYPTPPLREDQPSLRPSWAFQRSTYVVIIAVFLFCLLYLLLLALSAGLLAGSVYGAVALLTFAVNIYTIIIAVGLVGLGIMFFAFFVKFVFAVNQSHNPRRLEVTAEDQPRLHEFIRQLAHATQAPMPQKIFLVPDVNAAVFYHSSFWSMFLPVRKNLEIGLGLVNSLTIGEFKAVLAHEFGHFSQHSMKLGSYVYTVNRVLYNLVYEYDRWDQWLDEWAAAGSGFSFFAIITRSLVNGVRHVLRAAYEQINRQYASLSRQMEYHADLVATSVAGHAPMISALRRVELSAHAYEECTHFLNHLAEQGKRSEDLYANHRTMLARLAEHYALKLEHGLPLIPDGALTKNLAKSRISLKDQWASHPARRERERNMLSYPVAVDAHPQSAWKLFKNSAALCREVTERLYDIALPNQSFELLSPKEFTQHVTHEEEKYRIAPSYGGFYDGRLLLVTDPSALVATDHPGELTFETVYSEEHRRKITSFFTNQNDFETLKQIQAGTIAVSYFEFDGRKYRKREVGKLLRLLNSELARQQRWLAELDQQAFQLHYQEARHAGVVSEYVARYQKLIRLQETHHHLTESQHQIDYWQNQMGTKTHWSEEEARELTRELSNVEVKLKSHLRASETMEHSVPLLTETTQKILTPYLNGDQAYFLKVATFDEEGFARFTSLVLNIKHATSLAYRQALKSLTDYQMGLQEAVTQTSTVKHFQTR